MKEYVFKCHRHLVDGVDKIYPINTIAHHPVYGTFATGGCDKIVNIWDGLHRKRLAQLQGFETRFYFFFKHCYLLSGFTRCINTL